MLKPKNENEEFNYYFKISEPFVLNLTEVSERINAAAWLKKISGDENSKLRIAYLKLLLFVLQRRRLMGPFAAMPDEGPLKQFPGSNGLEQMMEGVIEMEKVVLRDSLEEDGCGDWPPYTSSCDGQQKQYAAMQEIPNFGLQSFFAVSQEPLVKWTNFEKAILPVGFKPIEHKKFDVNEENFHPDISSYIEPQMLSLVNRELTVEKPASPKLSPKKVQHQLTPDKDDEDVVIVDDIPSPKESPVVEIPSAEEDEKEPEKELEVPKLQVTPVEKKGILKKPTMLKSPSMKKKHAELLTESGYETRIPPTWGSNLIDANSDIDVFKPASIPKENAEESVEEDDVSDVVETRSPKRIVSTQPNEEDYKHFSDDFELLKQGLPLTTPSRSAIPKMSPEFPNFEEMNFDFSDIAVLEDEDLDSQSMQDDEDLLSTMEYEDESPEVSSMDEQEVESDIEFEFEEEEVQIEPRRSPRKSPSPEQKPKYSPEQRTGYSPELLERYIFGEPLPDFSDLLPDDGETARDRFKAKVKEAALITSAAHPMYSQPKHVERNLQRMAFTTAPIAEEDLPEYFDLDEEEEHEQEFDLNEMYEKFVSNETIPDFSDIPVLSDTQDHFFHISTITPENITDEEEPDLSDFVEETLDEIVFNENIDFSNMVVFEDTEEGKRQQRIDELEAKYHLYDMPATKATSPQRMSPIRERPLRRPTAAARQELLMPVRKKSPERLPIAEEQESMTPAQIQQSSPDYPHEIAFSAKGKKFYKRIREPFQIPPPEVELSPQSRRMRKILAKTPKLIDLGREMRRMRMHKPADPRYATHMRRPGGIKRQRVPTRLRKQHESLEQRAVRELDEKRRAWDSSDLEVIDETIDQEDWGRSQSPASPSQRIGPIATSTITKPRVSPERRSPDGIVFGRNVFEEQPPDFSDIPFEEDEIEETEDEEVMDELLDPNVLMGGEFVRREYADFITSSLLAKLSDKDRRVEESPENLIDERSPDLEVIDFDFEVDYEPDYSNVPSLSEEDVLKLSGVTPESQLPAKTPSPVKAPSPVKMPSPVQAIDYGSPIMPLSPLRKRVVQGRPKKVVTPSNLKPGIYASQSPASSKKEINYDLLKLERAHRLEPKRKVNDEQEGSDLYEGTPHRKSPVSRRILIKTRRRLNWDEPKEEEFDVEDEKPTHVSPDRSLENAPWDISMIEEPDAGSKKYKPVSPGRTPANWSWISPPSKSRTFVKRKTKLSILDTSPPVLIGSPTDISKNLERKSKYPDSDEPTTYDLSEIISASVFEEPLPDFSDVYFEDESGILEQEEPDYIDVRFEELPKAVQSEVVKRMKSAPGGKKGQRKDLLDKRREKTIQKKASTIKQDPKKVDKVQKKVSAATAAKQEKKKGVEVQKKVSAVTAAKLEQKKGGKVQKKVSAVTAAKQEQKKATEVQKKVSAVTAAKLEQKKAAEVQKKVSAVTAAKLEQKKVDATKALLKKDAIQPKKGKQAVIDEKSKSKISVAETAKSKKSTVVKISKSISKSVLVAKDSDKAKGVRAVSPKQKLAAKESVIAEEPESVRIQNKLRRQWQLDYEDRYPGGRISPEQMSPSEIPQVRPQGVSALPPGAAWVTPPHLKRENVKPIDPLDKLPWWLSDEVGTVVTTAKGKRFFKKVHKPFEMRSPEVEMSPEAQQSRQFIGEFKRLIDRNVQRSDFSFKKPADPRYAMHFKRGGKLKQRLSKEHRDLETPEQKAIRIHEKRRKAWKPSSQMYREAPDDEAQSDESYEDLDEYSDDDFEPSPSEKVSVEVIFESAEVEASPPIEREQQQPPREPLKGVVPANWNWVSPPQLQHKKSPAMKLHKPEKEVALRSPRILGTVPSSVLEQMVFSQKGSDDEEMYSPEHLDEEFIEEMGILSNIPMDFDVDPDEMDDFIPDVNVDNRAEDAAQESRSLLDESLPDIGDDIFDKMIIEDLEEEMSFQEGAMNFSDLPVLEDQTVVTPDRLKPGIYANEPPASRDKPINYDLYNMVSLMPRREPKRKTPIKQKTPSDDAYYTTPKQTDIKEKKRMRRRRIDFDIEEPYKLYEGTPEPASRKQIKKSRPGLKPMVAPNSLPASAQKFRKTDVNESIVLPATSPSPPASYSEGSENRGLTRKRLDFDEYVQYEGTPEQEISRFERIKQRNRRQRSQSPQAIERDLAKRKQMAAIRKRLIYDDEVGQDRRSPRQEKYGEMQHQRSPHLVQKTPENWKWSTPPELKRKEKLKQQENVRIAKSPLRDQLVYRGPLPDFSDMPVIDQIIDVPPEQEDEFGLLQPDDMEEFADEYIDVKFSVISLESDTSLLEETFPETEGIELMSDDENITEPTPDYTSKEIAWKTPPNVPPRISPVRERPLRRPTAAARQELLMPVRKKSPERLPIVEEQESMTPAQIQQSSPDYPHEKVFSAKGKQFYKRIREPFKIPPPEVVLSPQSRRMRKILAKTPKLIDLGRKMRRMQMHKPADPKYATHMRRPGGIKRQRVPPRLRKQHESPEQRAVRELDEKRRAWDSSDLAVIDETIDEEEDSDREPPYGMVFDEEPLDFSDIPLEDEADIMSSRQYPKSSDRDRYAEEYLSEEHSPFDVDYKPDIPYTRKSPIAQSSAKTPSPVKTTPIVQRKDPVQAIDYGSPIMPLSPLRKRVMYGAPKVIVTPSNLKPAVYSNAPPPSKDKEVFQDILMIEPRRYERNKKFARDAKVDVTPISRPPVSNIPQERRKKPRRRIDFDSKPEESPERIVDSEMMPPPEILSSPVQPAELESINFTLPEDELSSVSMERRRELHEYRRLVDVQRPIHPDNWTWKTPPGFAKKPVQVQQKSPPPRGLMDIRRAAASSANRSSLFSPETPRIDSRLLDESPPREYITPDLPIEEVRSPSRSPVAHRSSMMEEMSPLRPALRHPRDLPDVFENVPDMDIFEGSPTNVLIGSTEGYDDYDYETAFSEEDLPNVPVDERTVVYTPNRLNPNLLMGRTPPSAGKPLADDRYLIEARRYENLTRPRRTARREDGQHDEARYFTTPKRRTTRQPKKLEEVIDAVIDRHTERMEEQFDRMMVEMRHSGSATPRQIDEESPPKFRDDLA